MFDFLCRSTVRLDWASSFRGDGSPSDCAQVDFMVKSHPRFQASAYKLSDLTAKGQTSAVLNVDASSDFVFQAKKPNVPFAAYFFNKHD